MSQANAPVPDNLIELWALNFNCHPNQFSPLIISLIRISIAYQQWLNNGQHLQILRKLTSIAGTPNVSIFLKLEILIYLGHVAVKYFTVECQNDILESIRLLFNKSFIDSDPIVKKAAFIVYRRVIAEAKHEDIFLEHITDDEIVKMELFNFMKKHKTLTKSRDEEIEFLHELSTHSIRHHYGSPKLYSTEADSLPENDSKQLEMRQIIGRIQSETRKLLDLNKNQQLTDEFCKNISSIRQELASLK